MDSSLLYTCACCCVVSLLWGCTNVLLRAGSEQTAPVNPTGNRLVDVLLAVRATLLNWRFTLPFLVNQSGSLVYFALLGNADVTIAVPLCNALTVLVTGATARAFGGPEKEPLTLASLAGTALILAGIGLCINSRM